MDEFLTWLLPLFLLTGFVIPQTNIPPRVRSVTLQLLAGELGVMTLTLMLSGSLMWEGITLFALDSFHALKFDLFLTWWTLPTLWLVLWWMIQDEDRVFAWPLWFLLIALLSDNLWLWWGCCAAVMVLRSRFTKTTSREIARHACAGLSLLLALFVCGMLSFDFDVSRFSELRQLSAEWESFPESRQSELVLAVMFSGLGIALWSGVFPVSVLRIERESPVSHDLPLTLLAVLLAVRLQPLLDVIPVLAVLQPLFVMTIVISLINSLVMLDVRNVLRAQLTALLMSGFAGILCPVNESSAILSLEHLLLTILLWSLMEKNYSENRRASVLLAGLSGWLLLGFTGWSEVLVRIASPLFGEIGGQGVVVLMAAVISYQSGCFWLAKQQSTSQPLSLQQFMISGSIALMIVFSLRLGLWFLELPIFVTPSLAALAGVALGLASIWGLQYQKKKASRSASHHREAIYQLGSSQLHTLPIWELAVQLPSVMVAVISTVKEAWKRRPLRNLREGAVANERHQELFWEFLLAAISLFVLASLFLWTKG